MRSMLRMIRDDEVEEEEDETETSRLSSSLGNSQASPHLPDGQAQKP